MWEFVTILHCGTKEGHRLLLLLFSRCYLQFLSLFFALLLGLFYQHLLTKKNFCKRGSVAERLGRRMRRTLVKVPHWPLSWRCFLVDRSSHPCTV